MVQGNWASCVTSGSIHAMPAVQRPAIVGALGRRGGAQASVPRRCTVAHCGGAAAAAPRPASPATPAARGPPTAECRRRRPAEHVSHRVGVRVPESTLRGCASVPLPLASHLEQAVEQLPADQHVAGGQHQQQMVLEPVWVRTAARAAWAVPKRTEPLHVRRPWARTPHRRSAHSQCQRSARCSPCCCRTTRCCTAGPASGRRASGCRPAS